MHSWAGAVDSLKEAIAQETAETGKIDDIPVQYRVKVENGGTIEKISYNTKDYFGDKGEITKQAYVYLPAGYDGTKQYPVLYLI